jgi:hypothetical protein
MKLKNGMNMKKLLLFIAFIILVLNLYSQEISYQDLVTGSKPKGEFTTYKSKDGTVFKIGDRLLLGLPSSRHSFSNITWGNSLSAFPENHLPRMATGLEARIKKMTVKGFKKTGYYLLATCSTPINKMFVVGIRLENALQDQEIGLADDRKLSKM